MSASQDAAKVAKYLRGYYVRKLAALQALAKTLAEEMLADFQTRQGFAQETRGEFWHNRFSEAVRKVYAEDFTTESKLGFFIAHGVYYGVYLELANDRKYEALRPMIEEWGNRFLDGAGSILGGTNVKAQAAKNTLARANYGQPIL